MFFIQRSLKLCQPASHGDGSVPMKTGTHTQVPHDLHDYRIFLLPYAGKGKGSRHRCVLRNSHIHDLSGVARQQLEALVDAACLEVVALGVALRLGAEVLLRQDAVEDYIDFCCIYVKYFH